jgi:hypothetical protein
MVPGLDFGRWREIVRTSRYGDAKGIICVRNEAGTIAALAVYALEGMHLVVEHAIALDMMNRSIVADALIQGLEAKGREHGAVAIRARVGAAEERLLSRLAVHGHQPRLVYTCKPLACSHGEHCEPDTCFPPRRSD